MRLTRIIREAFVRSVMNDVPSIDYFEQYRKLYQTAVLSKAPAEVRAAYPKHQAWLSREHIWTAGSIPGFYCVCERNGTVQIDPAIQAQLDEIDKLYSQQNDARHELQMKLKGVVESCTTRKALAQALPEFEKYLPKEEDKVSNLPALANVMTDFMKAGWPKDRAAADVVT